MKKKLFIILSGIVIIILGVFLLINMSKEEDEYAGFKHYNANLYANLFYTFTYEDGPQNYAVVNLREVPMGGNDYALLYRIGVNDYIALDEMYLIDVPLNKENYYFYENTKTKKDYLYIRSDVGATEYTLDGKNTTKKDLTFDLSKLITAKTIMYKVDEINSVVDDYIYFYASYWGWNDNTPVDGGAGNIKCSLSDYVCEKA